MSTSTFAATDLELASLLGELARPVLHECNNFLNNLLMQIALLEDTSPESIRADFEALKRNGKQLANLVAEWQSYRKPNASGPASVDLADLCDEVLREVVGDFKIPASSVAVLGPRPLTIRSTPGPLRRLLYFLLADSVVAAQNQDKPAVVEVQWDSSKTLHIDDNRPAPPGDLLAEWFTLGEPDPGRLPLAACGSLAFRCNARLAAEQSPLGGVRVIVSFF